MRSVGAEEDLLFLQPETRVYDQFIVIYHQNRINKQELYQVSNR